jgi:hypothetical protein
MDTGIRAEVGALSDVLGMHSGHGRFYLEQTMSVDYYLACRKCKKSIHVAQDGMSGFTFYRGEPDCMLKLSRFLSDHTIGEHDVRYINENEGIDGDYEQVEWKRI